MNVQNQRMENKFSRKNGGSKCAMKDCPNLARLTSTSGEKISYFTFPKDAERSALWIQACGRDDLVNKDNISLFKNYRVCSTHFEDRMFLNDLKNRLHTHAVPISYQKHKEEMLTTTKRILSDSESNELKRIKLSEFVTQSPSTSTVPAPNITCVEPQKTLLLSSYKPRKEKVRYKIPPINIQVSHNSTDSLVEDRSTERTKNEEFSEKSAETNTTKPMSSKNSTSETVSKEQIEEIFIKEETIDEDSNDRDYYESMVQNMAKDEYDTGTNSGNDDEFNRTLMDEVEEDYNNITGANKQKTDTNKDGTGDIIQSETLSCKSKFQYERQYKLFMEWRRENKTVSLSESVLLAYFQNLNTKMKPSSLWAIYSMLRMTIKHKHTIDISKYPRLSTFLKRMSNGYKPKKSKSLTPHEFQQFLLTAPDDKYLFTKVGLIFGILGSCRREELMKIELHHVEDLHTALLVHIPDAKKQTERQFVIGGSFYNLCKRYMKLRPPYLENVTRFFLNYQRGKCTKQPVGINKFGSLAGQAARFLKLPDSNLYTGHCFRRSTPTILIDSGFERPQS